MTAIDRRAFIAGLRAGNPDALVVTGLGNPTYDVAAAGDTDHNFYLWGAMGGAAPLALGLALAQPARRVIVVTGDGEMLMGAGSFATIAAKAPSNLALCVLDNHAFAETGEQSGLTGRGTDLAGMAAAAGFAATFTARDAADADRASTLLAGAAGPVCVVVKVAVGGESRVLVPREGVHQVWRFRAALGIENRG